MEPEPRVEPQLKRALEPRKSLAGVLSDLRDQNKREQARASLKDAETSGARRWTGSNRSSAAACPLTTSQTNWPKTRARSKRQRPRADAHRMSRPPARSPTASARSRARIRNLVVPDANASQEDAIRSAEHAAAALARADTKAEARAAALRESAQAAQQLAEKLADGKKAVTPPAPPSEPELALKPEHAARAAELARRERQIKERFQALLGERVGSQQQIRKDAVTLGEELTDLRDRVRNVSDRAALPRARGCQPRRKPRSAGH